PRKSVYRYAGLVRGKLEACLYLAPTVAGLPPRDTAMNFLGRQMEPAERLSLLAAAVPDNALVAEKIICACFSVGMNSIVAAIRDGNLRTAAEIGLALKA